MEKTFDETWFYAPLNAVRDKVLLSTDEAHHFQRVLRLNAGIQIIVTNGQGSVFICKTRDKEKNIEIEAVEAKVLASPQPRLNMVLSLLKNRDIEDPVEGLCQLNIATIHLVTTDHSQDFKGQDHSRVLERLRQKSLVAIKQAKKAWLTAINPPIPLKKWRGENPGPIILVHPGPDKLVHQGNGKFYLLSGPEGGFSTEELEWLCGPEQADTLGLGDTRIRGTHAPLFACGKLLGLGRF